MRFFTSIGASGPPKPATEPAPDVGGGKHVSIGIAVAFPPPFGPENPTIWLFSTPNEMLTTPVVRAYLFVSSLTLIMVFFNLEKISTLETAENNRKLHWIHSSETIS